MNVARLGLLPHVGRHGERPAALLLDALGEGLDPLGARGRRARPRRPRAAQASAVASPMPEQAPVTATTWFERSMVIAPSLSLPP